VRRSRAGAARNSCPAGLRCRTGGDARIRGNEKPVVPVSLAAPFRPTQQRAGAPSGAPGLLLCQEAGVSPCAPGRRPFRSSALGWPDARNHAPKAAVTTSERRDPESNWDTTIFRRGSSAVETSRKACIYAGSGGPILASTSSQIAEFLRRFGYQDRAQYPNGRCPGAGTGRKEVAHQLGRRQRHALWSTSLGFRRERGQTCFRARSLRLWSTLCSWRSVSGALPCLPAGG
jgi:hypothetical protein